jgi:hypothetical protein
VNEDSGGLLVAALSLFGIWAAGCLAVQIITHFWKPLLVAGVVIGLLWFVLAVAQAWAEESQEWQRKERDWYDGIEHERELLRRKEQRLESLHAVHQWERERIDQGQTD